MTYQKPEVVLNGTAISAIEAGLFKDGGQDDNEHTQTEAVYVSEE
jgi:hypothetical protein